MKAKTYRQCEGGSEPCEASEATLLAINIPGPSGLLLIPVRQVEGGPTPWQWDGNVEAPTLHPSLRTRGSDCRGDWVCHSWVRKGKVQFLADCTHPLAGRTVDLLDLTELLPG